MFDIEELINEEENDNDKADVENIIQDNKISKNAENAFEIMAKNA